MYNILNLFVLSSCSERDTRPDYYKIVGFMLIFFPSVFIIKTQKSAFHVI